MNVNLIYEKSGYNFQISPYTPQSFLYEVTNKVFKIPLQFIELYYKDQFIPNDSQCASKNFKSFPITIKILDLRKANSQSFFSLREPPNKIPTKLKKNYYVKCQICHHKDAILYCRECNVFVCFECNIKYPEHFEHPKINLESGDVIQSFLEYRDSIINQLTEISNAYRFSNENSIDDKNRDEIFNNLSNLLNELNTKTHKLNIMDTTYTCSNDILMNFNNELRDIASPNNKEEVENSFGFINDKEHEIRNYLPFINLHVIKSKFNVKMTKFFQGMTKLLNSLMIEVNIKLNEALNLDNTGLKDLILYNKEKFGERNEDNLSDSDSGSSSSSSKSEKKKDDNKIINDAHVNNSKNIYFNYQKSFINNSVNNNYQKKFNNNNINNSYQKNLIINNSVNNLNCNNIMKSKEIFLPKVNQSFQNFNSENNNKKTKNIINIDKDFYSNISKKSNQNNNNNSPNGPITKISQSIIQDYRNLNSLENNLQQTNKRKVNLSFSPTQLLTSGNIKKKYSRNDKDLFRKTKTKNKVSAFSLNKNRGYIFNNEESMSNNNVNIESNIFKYKLAK